MPVSFRIESHGLEKLKHCWHKARPYLSIVEYRIWGGGHCAMVLEPWLMHDGLWSGNPALDHGADYVVFRKSPFCEQVLLQHCKSCFPTRCGQFHELQMHVQCLQEEGGN